MLKHFLSAILLCLFLTFTILAQNNVSLANAILIDEFGHLQVSELAARLDNLVSQSQNQPGSKIYLLHFRSRLELPGASSRFLNGMKNYLMKGRGVSGEQIVLVEGGAINCRTTQLWVAPIGTVPKSEISAYQITFEDDGSARKFDEYYFDLDFSGSDYIDIENGYGFGDVNSLDAFAAAVKKEKGATAYVIIYQQFEGRYDGQTDAPNTAAKMARKIRSDLINKHKLAASKIRIVNGGNRKLRQVELWILPGGEHPPVATPNAFPKAGAKPRKRKIKK